MSIWRGPRDRGAEEFERVEGRSDVLRGARDRLRVLSFLNLLNFLFVQSPHRRLIFLLNRGQSITAEGQNFIATRIEPAPEQNPKNTRPHHSPKDQTR
ncbi:hypothetical protein C0431_03785 [bacterium]|nr:hypothetical protein [bacterium]